ncbi:MAG TPA: VOC family protein [Candidatus Acidoferrum sp.]|jgi:catechol 2,3-dioxygenase|nr:VOC family protein [Candidatus Angelobacter sp.]HXD80376.1 VOC family protein [Candidatus Acidoferrum sp.]
MREEWPLKWLELRVLDLDRESAFWRALGLAELRRSDSGARFGAGGRELLTLQALPGGRSRPRGTAGLYHLAVLLPSRGDLARFAKFGISRLKFTDASDHLVSEAIYFNDPEGNGIEVYADRAREAWEWSGSRVRMDSIQLDVERLANDAEGDWSGFPPTTRLGHVHLSVADLDRSQAWYEQMGMAVTATIPGAKFMSWDHYHHHIGLNVWAGRDLSPIAESCAGLAGFVISADSTDGSGQDPDGVRIMTDAQGSDMRGTPPLSRTVR